MKLQAPLEQIHVAVQDYYRTITIEALFEIGKEQLGKKNATRLMGKRSLARILQARQRQNNKTRKHGRKAYWPESWAIV